jgi:hypothetical protein
MNCILNVNLIVDVKRDSLFLAGEAHIQLWTRACTVQLGASCFKHFVNLTRKAGILTKKMEASSHNQLVA